MAYDYSFRMTEPKLDHVTSAWAPPSGDRAPVATNPAGDLVAWQDRTGALRSSNDAMADEAMTRGGWVAGWQDKRGRILAGLQRDGGFYQGVGSPPMPTAQPVTDGSDTLAQVIVADGSARRRLSIFESAVESVERADAGLIRAGCADGSVRFAAFHGVGNETALSTTLRVIIYIGQSLSVGGVNSNAAAYLDNPLSDMLHTSGALSGRNRIQMFQTTLNGGAGFGIVPHGAFAPAMAQADFTGLVDAYEQVLLSNFGETGMLDLAWMLNGPTGRAYGGNYLVCSFGQANKSYSQLKKGTQPYTNLINGMTQLPTIAAAAGYTGVVIEAIIWDQGENDSADDEATYLAKLEELHDDLTADLNTALAAASSYRMYVLQKGIFVSGDLTGPCKAQLSITAANPLITCCGPQYMAHFEDHFHPTSKEHRVLAAYRGKAIEQIRRGYGFQPLRLASWRMIGAREFEMTFSGGYGGVVLDPTFVTDPGAAGLSYVDSGGAHDIIAVGEADAPNKLWGEFRGTPSGTSPYLRLGWNDGTSTAQGRDDGARTIIRDSDTRFVDPATGRILYAYACHERVLRS